MPCCIMVSWYFVQMYFRFYSLDVYFFHCKTQILHFDQDSLKPQPNKSLIPPLSLLVGFIGKGNKENMQAAGFVKK